MDHPWGNPDAGTGGPAEVCVGTAGIGSGAAGGAAAGTETIGGEADGMVGADFTAP